MTKKDSEFNAGENCAITKIEDDTERVYVFKCAAGKVILIEKYLRNTFI